MFGDVARLYERVRPSYPEALVDDVVELSGIDRGGRALEVGAGTGKATRLFAARGVQILAIDPSSQMAAVARRECAGYEGVTVEEHEFEDFRRRRRAVPAVVLGAGLALDLARGSLREGSGGARAGRPARGVLEPTAMVGYAAARRAARGLPARGRR